MNKCSTKLFIGMDVSEKNIEILALSGESDMSHTLKITNTTQAVNAFIDAYKGDKKSLVFVIETGTHSPWLADLILSRGADVYVANARKLRMIWGSDQKSDTRDAEMLARIAKFDPKLLGAIRHQPKETRIDLSVIKCRDVLVRTRTTMMNSVRGQLRSFGIKTGSIKPYNFSESAAKIIPGELRSAMDGVLTQIALLGLEIKKYDKKIEELCKKISSNKKA